MFDLETMAERKKVRLTTDETAVTSQEINTAKCIICQKSTPERTMSSENGRKRIRDAALIRDDIISKRLKVIDQEEFVYHMSNSCYKAYTMKSHLDRITSKGPDASEDNTPKRTARSSRSARPKPSPESEIYQKKCVVCGFVKHNDSYEKYRISESNRAKNFLKAAVFMQDDVYTRTCDLQDINAVFGADLYCHKPCVNKYILKYERLQEKYCDDKSTNHKKEAWKYIISDIENGLANGYGYELSFVRDAMNKQLQVGSVTNREVKLLLRNHFTDQICFSQSKQLNKSELFFSKGVSTENMADKIRVTDPIKECAAIIRQCLLDVDFDLQDRFCDATDLKTSWNTVPIPEPLLNFMAALYNFDPTEFAADLQVPDVEDDEPKDKQAGITASKYRQMQCLFQVMYHDLHCGRKRTPLHIMNSQAIYDSCKSSTLITIFNRFGLCSSYDELQRHQNDIASFTVESSSDIVPFPSHFDKSEYTVGAFDNFDHDEANLSGMGGSHDTVAVLFQDEGGSDFCKPRRTETNVEHGPRTFTSELQCQTLREFYKPAKKPDLPEDYTVSSSQSVNHDILNNVRSKEIAWLLSRMDLSETDPQHLSTRPKNQVMPIWSAANSALSVENVPIKRVGFLPVLPYPVTQYDSVYTAMKNFQGVLEYLDQSKLAVTCDEGVYHIAREIQLLRPKEFENLVLCLGSFHMAKVVLACIGKYIRNSGAENILIESSVFGINVVESVISGKNYVRSLKGLQLLKEAFARLEWEAFFNEENIAKHNDLLNILLQLKESVAAKSTSSLNNLHNAQDYIISNLVDDFDQFVSHSCEISETFRYWHNFLNLVYHLENLIRSDREGNWSLQLQAIQDLLPLFAAFDSINYLRWCSLYLEDMRRLPQIAPEVYSANMEGKFVIKRTRGNFTAVGADLALEQTINRAQKSASGIIGSSRKKKFVAKWELIYHEMIAITNLHRRLAGIGSSSYELEVNRSFSKATTEFEEGNIQAILDVVEKNENPFITPPKEKRLHNILTKEVMSEEIRQQLLNVEKIGSKAYEKLRTERYIKKTVRLSDTIHRTNLKNFASVHKESNVHKGKAKVQKCEDAKMKRTIEIAKERGRTMDELLQYDVSTVSPLFDNEGVMRKSVKSEIVHELESNLSEQDPRIPHYDKPKGTCYIVDVMANIRKIKTKSTKTFGEFSDAFFRYIDSTSKCASRIDLVFDSYVESSLKDSERLRREKKPAIELHDVSRTTPLPQEIDRFWPSRVNKTKFETLIHAEALTQNWTGPQVEVIVSNFYGPDSNVLPCLLKTSRNVEVSELKSEVEEADMRIIPHAMHAVKQGYKCIIVLSSDTDVFILLIFYWSKLNENGLEELWVKTGVADSTRYIPIHILAKKIGRGLCQVLPAVHTLTGCDYTSKVGTKHAALMANPETHLNDFMVAKESIDNAIVKAEAYLTQVLKKGTQMKTMNQLRNYKYHHAKRSGLDDLPPTSYAIGLHIKRAYFATHQMVSLLSSCEPLDPREFGFEIIDNLLVPSKGSNPIPEDLAIHCLCKKCGTQRCPCRTSKRPCCTFCACQSDLEKLVCHNLFGVEKR